METIFFFTYLNCPLYLTRVLNNIGHRLHGKLSAGTKNMCPCGQAKWRLVSPRTRGLSEMLAGWHYTVGGSTRRLLGDGQQLLSKETERWYVQGGKKGRELYAREAEKIQSRGKKRGSSVDDELRTTDEISWLPCVFEQVDAKGKGEGGGAVPSELNV